MTYCSLCTITFKEFQPAADKSAVAARAACTMDPEGSHEHLFMPAMAAFFICGVVHAIIRNLAAWLTKTP